MLVNPYLGEFNRQQELNKRQDYDFMRSMSTYQRRIEMVKRYAWAVPDKKAIEICREFSPLIEIGAGTGYWASLIRQLGGEVIPYDINPPKRIRNPYRHETEFMPIRLGGPNVLLKHEKKYNLFLCWPPYQSNMAIKSLRQFGGRYFVYVGEGSYGCTANDAFFAELSANWKQVKEHNIPQWDGIHDSLTVYERK